MTDIETIAGPRPKKFGEEKAKLALKNPKSIIEAFLWGETPQGYNYWRDYRNGESLNPKEAQAILRYWLGEKDKKEETLPKQEEKISVFLTKLKRY